MVTRDTSLAVFEELLASGTLRGLKLLVYAAICEIGPVHNLRLLEYLQQKEIVDKLKKHRIVWTRSNCWPRVTDLVSAGHVIDAGPHRLAWYGKTKTLHVWYVASANTKIPSAWEKVEWAEKTEKKIRPVPSLAVQAMRISSASQAGRVLQACRHKKTKSGQTMLFKI